MRFASILLATSLFATACLPAVADTVTTFTLTHGSTTFQVSLTPSTPFTHSVGSPVKINTYQYTVPITVNGVTLQPGPPQYGTFGIEDQQIPGAGAQVFFAYVYSDNDGLHDVDLFELGNQVYTIANGVPVFHPETVTFPESVYLDDPRTGTGSTTYGTGDVLVITQSDPATSPVPEPSTIALLGTGLIGAAGFVRRRLF